MRATSARTRALHCRTQGTFYTQALVGLVLTVLWFVSHSILHCAFLLSRRGLSQLLSATWHSMCLQRRSRLQRLFLLWRSVCQARFSPSWRTFEQGHPVFEGIGSELDEVASEVDGGVVTFGEPKRCCLGKSSPLSLSSPPLPSFFPLPPGAVAAVFVIEGIVAAVCPVMVESPEHGKARRGRSKASEGLSAGALAETLSARGAADEVDVESVVVGVQNARRNHGQFRCKRREANMTTKRGLKSRCAAPPKNLSKVRVLTVGNRWFSRHFAALKNLFASSRRKVG